MSVSNRTLSETYTLVPSIPSETQIWRRHKRRLPTADDFVVIFFIDPLILPNTINSTIYVVKIFYCNLYYIICFSQNDVLLFWLCHAIHRLSYCCSGFILPIVSMIFRGSSLQQYSTLANDEWRHSKSMDLATPKLIVRTEPSSFRPRETSRVVCIAFKHRCHVTRLHTCRVGSGHPLNTIANEHWSSFCRFSSADLIRNMYDTPSRFRFWFWLIRGFPGSNSTRLYY